MIINVKKDCSRSEQVREASALLTVHELNELDQLDQLDQMDQSSRSGSESFGFRSLSSHTTVRAVRHTAV